MEDRPSVLETVRPTNALGRLAARTRASRVAMLIVAVIAVLLAVYLGKLLFIDSTFTGVQDVPSVPR